jgi:hypothetical protein
MNTQISLLGLQLLTHVLFMKAELFLLLLIPDHCELTLYFPLPRIHFSLKVVCHRLLCYLYPFLLFLKTQLRLLALPTLFHLDLFAIIFAQLLLIIPLLLHRDLITTLDGFLLRA